VLLLLLLLSGVTVAAGGSAVITALRLQLLLHRSCHWLKVRVFYTNTLSLTLCKASAIISVEQNSL
jgi:hypothetical protein